MKKNQDYLGGDFTLIFLRNDFKKLTRLNSKKYLTFFLGILAVTIYFQAKVAHNLDIVKIFSILAKIFSIVPFLFLTNFGTQGILSQDNINENKYLFTMPINLNKYILAVNIEMITIINIQTMFIFFPAIMIPLYIHHEMYMILSLYKFIIPIIFIEILGISLCNIYTSIRPHKIRNSIFSVGTSVQPSLFSLLTVAVCIAFFFLYNNLNNVFLLPLIFCIYFLSVIKLKNRLMDQDTFFEVLQNG